MGNRQGCCRIAGIRGRPRSTITSQGEQDFVTSIFDGERTWIGLTDDPEYGGTESFGQANHQVDGWVWVTGEPVVFTSWNHANEPNNQGGDENFGMMDNGRVTGGWNDVPGNWNFARYIVEFEVAASESLNLSHWPIADGGNGHAYVQVIGNTAVDWAQAKAIAESLEYRGIHGHLVTITSRAEQDFVASLFDGGRTWIGLTDDPAYGGSESFGQPNPKVDGWVWVTGEAVSYTHWFNANTPNNRDNQGRVENFGMIEGEGTATWNDVPSGVAQWNFPRFLIEFDVVMPWHNSANPVDVDDDTAITGGDALSIVNYLNTFSTQEVSPTAAPGLPFGFLDVDGDNFVAPNDALYVINVVNTLPDREPQPSTHSAEDLLDLLAADVTRSSQRRRSK